MKKSNWQRAKEIILATVSPTVTYNRSEIIALLRRHRVGDLDGNWVDQLLRSLVDRGLLKRTGRRGAMRYAAARKAPVIDLRSTVGPKKAAATKRGSISEMALAAAKKRPASPAIFQVSAGRLVIAVNGTPILFDLVRVA